MPSIFSTHGTCLSFASTASAYSLHRIFRSSEYDCREVKSFSAVGSKLKCPVFVASEMSGFKVVPSPIGLGWFWGWGCRGRGQFHFPCSSL